MTEDDRSLDELTHAQCWQLLAGQEVGRLGVLADGYPLVVPVNFGLDGDVIVFRSEPGTKLAAAAHANVTFEVDAFDAATSSGWSVLVRGLAEEVSESHRLELVERTRSAASPPWVPGENEHWVRIIPHRVTGRHIRPASLPPAFEDAGYL